MAELSPMMKQYLNIKDQHKDHIVFFRLGDFYEMFYDDALLASKELELTLTGRDCGQEERAPMCGIPYHSCESYIARLVAKGYKVAICEQTEDPALAKGIVKREIVRVITPGTVIEGSMLDESKNNYLCSIYLLGKACGIAFADISTGEMYATSIQGDGFAAAIINELGRFMPSEIICNPEASENIDIDTFIKNRLNASISIGDDADTSIILSHFKVLSLEEIGLDDLPEAVHSVSVLLNYIYFTQKIGVERIQKINLYSSNQFMQIDISTRRNLEITETMRNKEKRGSLLGVLDKTKTAMGKRLIRNWLDQPLVNPAFISRRLNAVDELFNNAIVRIEIAELLTGIYDIERLMTRIIYGSANGRELKSLSYTISKLPLIREIIVNSKSQMLMDIYHCIDPLEDIHTLIESAIVDEPPVTVREGGMIKKGYNAEIDELLGIMNDGKGFISRIEASERERTGIKTLKIGYNRIFGYYIEITRSNMENAPPEYIRKQTLANCERYITQELKELESKVLGAQDKIVQLEYELFTQIREQVAAQLTRIQRSAQGIAQLDTLCSFAEVAFKNGYTRPEIKVDSKIMIKDGRHPVVESILHDVPFVPNDTELDVTDNKVAIITGPNMAGKSTYMRQVAIITLMAQIGSFVPASSASIGIVDSIFTRVGASDDLAAGQSTFMVEMSEVAHILKNATKNSLIILDEIGRGTSTFDGMSIARAVVEYISEKISAKTLFATHYHELTELEEVLKGIKNYNVAVRKRGDDITFLRRIIRGGADDSYGIEVAKLAGVPEAVVSRAKEVLKLLEETEFIRVDAPRGAKKIVPKQTDENQLSLGMNSQTEIMQRLKIVDVNTLTPIEALNTLYALCKLAKE